MAEMVRWFFLLVSSSLNLSFYILKKTDMEFLCVL